MVDNHTAAVDIESHGDDHPPATSTASVTVVCACYNHERTIAQALDSFLGQKANFSFCVLVGDDASTDGSAAIITDYANRFPEIIIPVLRDENIGGGRNWEDLISRCDSRYIAFCDGDDYWTDEGKLQMQFDLMESDESLRACFHDALIVDETVGGRWFQLESFSHTKDGLPRWPSGNRYFVKKRRYHVRNFIPFGFIHTSSMFVRWNYSVGFPPWIFGHGFGDYPLWAIQVGIGDIGFIDRTMSVYRRTGNTLFDFSSRSAYWLESKRGGIAIDDGLIGHFSSVCPDRRIVAALRRRKADDLAKLIAGSLDNEEPNDTRALIEEYRDDIESCFGVAVPDALDGDAFASFMRKLVRKAPIPPYRQSKIGYFRALKNKARKLLTIAS